MPGEGLSVEWSVLPGNTPCPGCERGPIPAGARALRIRRGPRGTERLVGQCFHGYGCLVRRAEECAFEEEARRSGRAEAYREVEAWARDQDRARRQAPG